MKLNWTVVALAAVAVIAANPADARSKRQAQVRPACVDRPVHFSWFGILTNPAPQPNGCAPPVYAYGEYVGQDPDPFIRLQLLRDPATGYTSQFSR